MILTVDTTDLTARVSIAGDLDYTTNRDFVDTVSRLLAECPGLRHLHIGCAGLTFCDSAGLSALLRVRHRCAEAAVQLHLDERPVHLTRILEITGMLEHLTAPPDADTDAAQSAPAEITDGADVLGRRAGLSD